MLYIHKKFGYKPPKTIRTSFVIRINFFHFATVARTTPRATVDHQTKTKSFFIPNFSLQQLSPSSPSLSPFAIFRKSQAIIFLVFSSYFSTTKHEMMETKKKIKKMKSDLFCEKTKPDLQHSIHKWVSMRIKEG